MFGNVKIVKGCVKKGLRSHLALSVLWLQRLFFGCLFGHSRSNIHLYLPGNTIEQIVKRFRHRTYLFSKKLLHCRGFSPSVWLYILHGFTQLQFCLGCSVGWRLVDGREALTLLHLTQPAVCLFALLYNLCAFLLLLISASAKLLRELCCFKRQKILHACSVFRGSQCKCLYNVVRITTQCSGNNHTLLGITTL